MRRDSSTARAHARLGPAGLAAGGEGTRDGTGPDGERLLLPEGTRLVHIGPHKTGTTSLQAALYAARPALLEQGVRHVGKTRNPASAVRAVTGQNAPDLHQDRRRRCATGAIS